MRAMKKSGGLDGELWDIVLETAESRNVGIASGCEQHLRDMIDRAVETLNAYQRPGSSRELDQAKERLRVFVAAMADEAVAQGRPDLHEDIFDKVRRIFCPGFFPFC